MDNTINYIFEVYDDMKIKTFLNYFTPSNQNQHSSTFYEPNYSRSKRENVTI